MKHSSLLVFVTPLLFTGCDPGTTVRDGGPMDAHAGDAPSADVQTPVDASRSESLRDLARFTDRNPDPRIVEVDLEARAGAWEISPGRTVQALLYNGSAPGPLLEAHVGDEIIVHFTNRLDAPTTIHWHGIRVPNAMDGAPDVQAPVAPGATFEYRFTVPDAGTYWYHPHIDEPTQMERGLVGAIIVRGNSEPAFDSESVLVLDDVLLTADGQIAMPNDAEQHSGREGNLQLVNGRALASLRVRPGTRHRWRIINASSARFHRLAIAGQHFVVLGGDGGFYERPLDADELMLVPGDRLDVVVDATGAAGSTAMLQALPVDRGQGAGTVVPIDVLRLEYTHEPTAIPAPIPTMFATIPPIATTGVTARRVTFSERTDSVTHRVTFLINGVAAPDVPPIETTIGTTEVWDLVNLSEMDHPFHLHGYFFQVVSTAGVPAPFVSWEDTVLLRGMTTTRIAFRPDDRPGMWMYHCHILEHIANGMMAHLHVRP